MFTLLLILALDLRAFASGRGAFRLCVSRGLSLELALGVVLNLVVEALLLELVLQLV
jgi:hypothetical protein